jgi:RHS repeat-associated protein
MEVPINFALTGRGFTGHEHYPELKIINMNGRLYDPVIGRFFSPDKYVANSSFTQDFNRYSYARNNPLHYTDPSGEIIIPILIGAFVGAMINVVANLNNMDNIWQGFGFAAIGALAGGLGAGIGAGTAVAAAGGSFIAGFMGKASVTAIGFGAGFGSGFAGGFAGGFTGGFITGAGNTWLQGGSFGQGLGNGMKSGMISGFISGATAGIAGGIKGMKTKGIFYKGLDELGLNAGGPIPDANINSAFLAEAKEVWFNGAPDPLAYIIDNGSVTGNYPGAAIPDFKNGLFSGKGTLYFNKELAFTSAEKLFRTMGHELVHLSQFAGLAGESARLWKLDIFRDMLDHHAVKYTNLLGGNYWDSSLDLPWQNIFPQHYNTMDYKKFSWTHNYLFKWPF